MRYGIVGLMISGFEMYSVLARGFHSSVPRPKKRKNRLVGIRRRINQSLSGYGRYEHEDFPFSRPRRTLPPPLPFPVVSVGLKIIRFAFFFSLFTFHSESLASSSRGHTIVRRSLLYTNEYIRIERRMDGGNNNYTGRGRTLRKTRRRRRPVSGVTRRRPRRERTSRKRFFLSFFTMRYSR